MPTTFARGIASGPESGGRSSALLGSAPGASRGGWYGCRRPTAGRGGERGTGCRAPYTGGAMTHRNHGPRIRRPAARRRLRRGGPRRRRARHRRAQDRRASAAGDSYIEDIPSERLRGGRRPHRGDDRTPQPLARCDAVLICVPTPLTANREPDLGPLLAATRALAGVLQAGQLVVLESTTYPGTTRERVAPMLEESGLVAGPRLPPRVLARARRPRPHRLHAAHDAEGRRRAHRGVRRPRRGALRARLRHASCASRRPRPPSWRSCSRTSSAR